MEARDVIKNPVITERTAELMELRQYTFEVNVKANKIQIKKAIEEIFGVKVSRVNTMNYKGKFRRFGRYTGFKPSRKKAIITLTEDSQEIEFFEGA
ncbi:LSU ribosomal protein L23P [Sinobaca qinghaiensis]|uniref:Large ribosomal subunit protein uL23 n=1 Tax=Sinobaca qinghaiensis TaxID=342944 RepID=A0A419UU16_9BACL|nr:50S ribosomal protein L23 [Sinobaca qinghaiensis]RKD67562.1 LSU ribosomal protein L23P [Sinobaca qinghaiensis]